MNVHDASTFRKAIPVVSVTESISLCILIAIMFVSFLYLFSPKNLPRDHPKTIKRRFLSVACVCVVGFFGIGLYLESKLNKSMGVRQLISELFIFYYLSPSEHDAGFIGYFLWSTFYPIALTLLIYLGSLFAMFYDKELPFQKHFNFRLWPKRSQALDCWMAWRNYIVGPLAEEVVFRSLMIPLLELSQIAPINIIFFSPLIFGVAHVHHGYSLYKTLKQMSKPSPLISATLSTVFQLLYTTIFGWYASYLFLKSRSLMAPLGAHIVCNVMGIPDIGRVFTDDSLSPIERKLFAVLYVTGAILFKTFFSACTSSQAFGTL